MSWGYDADTPEDRYLALYGGGSCVEDDDDPADWDEDEHRG